MPGEEASDDPIIDLIENFRLNTFYVCLDVINSAFKEYFGNGSIGIYKDLSLFSKKRLDEVKKIQHHFQKMLFQCFVRFTESMLMRTV